MGVHRLERMQRHVRSWRSADARSPVPPGDLSDADDESQRRRLSHPAPTGHAQATHLQPDALRPLEHHRMVQGTPGIDFPSAIYEPARELRIAKQNKQNKHDLMKIFQFATVHDRVR